MNLRMTGLKVARFFLTAIVFTPLVIASFYISGFVWHLIYGNILTYLAFIALFLGIWISYPVMEVKNSRKTVKKWFIIGLSVSAFVVRVFFVAMFSENVRFFSQDLYKNGTPTLLGLLVEAVICVSVVLVCYACFLTGVFLSRKLVRQVQLHAAP
ncbi:MAG: hypothetical protein Kilf2KO_29860 [Rhodospirillales bacterium]